MSHGTFALVFGKILRSSIWLEDCATRIMWITMLLLKDKHGMVMKSSTAGLAHVANITQEECEAAIEKFLAPDPHSGNQAEEGRRIRDVGDSWEIINHEEYQFSTAARRAAWAEYKKLQRERGKLGGQASGKKRRKRGDLPQPGEVRAVAALCAEEAEAIAEQTNAERLPHMMEQNPPIVKRIPKDDRHLYP